VKSKDDILDDHDAVATLRNSFAWLLAGHKEASRRVAEKERAEEVKHLSQFSSLLKEFVEARERDVKRAEATAEEFNLLEVLQVTHKEVRHSMVLAWLLDRSADRLGTHAQGALGFRLFLAEMGLSTEYADTNYWVRRELAGDESIVDIEIAARGKFIIQIENKIWASEGADQTHREWADLTRRAKDLGMDIEQPLRHIHAFYLTPFGTPPRNEQFVPISWQRIVRVFRAFAAQSKPSDVRLFANHYAKAVEYFINAKQYPVGDDDVETIIE